MSTGHSSPPTTGSGDEPVLHVWPGKWDLPTVNPECLAAILYAQIVLPGGFVVEECTNPDFSPNGHLPYLSTGLTTISTYASITKHVSKLQGGRGPRTGAELDALQLAQETAWLAFAQTHLGDLVACSFYTLKDNYWEFFRPALADMFPIPQKYYIPDRLRNLHKARLESVGLWNVAAEEREAEKNPNARAQLNEAVTSAFGREKVLEKARTHLDILANLLQDKNYFFGSEPSSLDAMVAAHILLLVVPPLPNDLLRVYITSNYPTLCTHAQRLRSLIQGEASLSASQSLLISTPYASEFDLQNAVAQSRSQTFVPLTIRTAPHNSLSAFTSIFSTWRSSSFFGEKVEKTDEEKKYDRLRWGWYALAVTSVFAWGAMSGLRIVVARPEDVNTQEEREEEKEPNSGHKDEEDKENEEENEEDVVEIEVEEDEGNDESE